MIGILYEEYPSAFIHFRPQFEVENNLKAPKRIIGFIGLKGKNVRNELGNYLKIKLEHRTLIFVYLGNYDLSILQWYNLEKMDDCIFITRDTHYYPPWNLKVLGDTFSYPDLMASVDLVVTKYGYSTLACAFQHGKPVIACDREQFCEGKVIRQFLIQKKV